MAHFHTIMTLLGFRCMTPVRCNIFCLLNAGVSLFLHDCIKHFTSNFLKDTFCIVQFGLNCNICEIHAHAQKLSVICTATMGCCKLLLSVKVHVKCQI